jgi:hypothetical protein
MAKPAGKPSSCAASTVSCPNNLPAGTTLGNLAAVNPRLANANPNGSAIDVFYNQKEYNLLAQAMASLNSPVNLWLKVTRQ